MPPKFDRWGIAFQYPENWTLEQTKSTAESNSVAVYSPGGAYWSLTIYSGTTPLEDLAIAVVKALQEEYDEVEAEAVAETIEQREVIGYDLHFYCLELTNTTVIRGFATLGANYLVVYQAEDREFDQLHNVFRAITISFLQEFGQRE